MSRLTRQASLVWSIKRHHKLRKKEANQLEEQMTDQTKIREIVEWASWNQFLSSGIELTNAQKETMVQKMLDKQKNS